MPLSAVLLVTASVVLHAGWNARLHRSDDPEVVVAMSYLLVGLALVPALVADPPTEVVGWVVVSSAAQAAYLGTLGTAYRQGSLSVAYPIARGTAPLLVALGGWLFLDETPSLPTGVGLVVLVSGLLLLAGLGRRMGERRVVLLAAVTGVATVAYSLVDAGAVDHTGPLGYLSVVMATSAVAVLIARRPGWRRLSDALAPGALVGVGQGGAYALVLVAFQQAQAGQVTGLRQLSVLLGVVVAREALGARALWGAGLVAAGAALVVW